MYRDILHYMTLKGEEEVEKYCLIKHYKSVNNGSVQSILCLKGHLESIGTRRMDLRAIGITEHNKITTRTQKHLPTS
jgi:hypothetical protein